MTSAHRPTFDHAKGRADHNKTSIVHKRFLPAHTQLKYRHVILSQQDDEYETTNIDLNKAKKSVQEMKLELISKEQEYFKSKDVEYKDLYLKDVANTKLRIENGDKEESFEQKRQRIMDETKDIDGSVSESDDNTSESGSESESDDEDETELLLKELEKLKRQKQENAKLNAKEELIDKIENENISINKSWRNETAFSNRNKKHKLDKDDNFVNDMLRNEFHKKFMDKYVK